MGSLVMSKTNPFFTVTVGAWLALVGASRNDGWSSLNRWAMSSVAISCSTRFLEAPWWVTWRVSPSAIVQEAVVQKTGA